MTQRSWAPREEAVLVPAVRALRAPLPSQVSIPAPRRPAPEPTSSSSTLHDPAHVAPTAPPDFAGDVPLERSWARRAHEHGHQRVRRPAPTASPDLRPSLRRAAGLAANLVVVIAVAAFLALAVGPHTGAYRTTTMLTGSMRPLYPPGSVLVITPQPASALAPGQVITFNAPIEDRRVVTHRVVSVDHSGSKPVIVTKGDANSGNDPWTAKVTGDTVWRVRGVVPHVGSALRALREPRVQFVLTRGLPALLLLTLLVSVWRPRPAAAPRHA